MGICSSSQSISVETAKLILQDGKLQEFPHPVKASHVLQKDPTCFICNSDDMEFDDLLSAVGADEELQPGHLYFALPLSRLKRPLQPQEMAALAVMASSVLGKRDVDSCCRKNQAPGGISGRGDAGGVFLVGSAPGGGPRGAESCGVVVLKRKRRSAGRGPAPKFQVELASILE